MGNEREEYCQGNTYEKHEVSRALKKMLAKTIEKNAEKLMNKTQAKKLNKPLTKQLNKPRAIKFKHYELTKENGKKPD